MLNLSECCCVQFAKRMGVKTDKPKVLFRPPLIEVETEPPPFLRGQADCSPPYSPATVMDRKDVGDVMKYFMKFDDNLVRQITPIILVVYSAP